MPTIPQDAVIRGSINRFGTTTSLESMLWCLNEGPSGFLNGSLQRYVEGGQEIFSFTSQTPTLIETMIMPNSVAAAYDNVSLQENTLAPITGCKAYLTAAGLGRAMWLGSLVIIRPDGRPLFIHGYFTGELQIYRQVEC